MSFKKASILIYLDKLAAIIINQSSAREILFIRCAAKVVPNVSKCITNLMSLLMSYLIVISTKSGNSGGNTF